MSTHTLNVLGKTLADLVPLVEEAVRLLDKPGTRALRRKIDKEFHFAVGVFGSLRREETDEDEWPALNLPRYRRATETWPAQMAYDARKAREAARWADDPAAPLAIELPNRGLRVVVDNTKSGRRSASLELPQGGAA